MDEASLGREDEEIQSWDGDGDADGDTDESFLCAHSTHEAPVPPLRPPGPPSHTLAGAAGGKPPGGKKKPGFKVRDCDCGVSAERVVYTDKRLPFIPTDLQVAGGGAAKAECGGAGQAPTVGEAAGIAGRPVPRSTRRHRRSRAASQPRGHAGKPDAMS
jgi:hypothetical protein